MNITIFFSVDGIPETGLTPTITIIKLDGTTIVSSATVTELVSGYYNYEFTGYDPSITYAVIADGGAGLVGGERYKTEVISR